MELHVYDFDGTLFISPVPPADWSDHPNAWWNRPVSLEPPYVPERPDMQWWINSTVESARDSVQDPDIYTILLTGRPDRYFRYRVPELLHQQSLDFDEVRLNPGIDTLRWKTGHLIRLVRRYEFDRVVGWEDRQGHLDTWAGEMTKRGIDFVGHLVTEASHPPLPKEAKFIRHAGRLYRRTAAAVLPIYTNEENQQFGTVRVEFQVGAVLEYYVVSRKDAQQIFAISRDADITQHALYQLEEQYRQIIDSYWEDYAHRTTNEGQSPEDARSKLDEIKKLARTKRNRVRASHRGARWHAYNIARGVTTEDEDAEDYIEEGEE